MSSTTLFLVPTPIGNLGDITLRALEVLRDVDVIACEDTRRTRKLLAAYNIHQSLISYERFSETKKVSRILELLAEGKNVALVSDAGTPLISDPGSILISQARNMGIRVESLPGPCAAIAALSASGFEGPFRFIGFFPRQKSVAQREITRMSLTSDHTVFYESPHRIMETLELLGLSLGDRTVCLAREISKIHEEYIVGSVREVIERLKDRKMIGEVTMIVHGSSQEEAIDETVIKQRADDLLRSGFSKKDILRVLTEETGMGRNRIYDILLKIG
ncbi:MAG TPA: 16S rRNA (cytidine(1402)-2'-O)-methyltransferase [Deltaproteobacteria bacterium]|nr:16S rRNA (cytidine(1402)-2'-O)-methyltransferase [Deltaproteobacteria bacterium]HQI01840.1 16S rRNA (cytidine(1402)-2'-O)-methyltransferase [Deltaproteobacteria bacterium]